MDISHVHRSCIKHKEVNGNHKHSKGKVRDTKILYLTLRVPRRVEREAEIEVEHT